MFLDISIITINDKSVRVKNQFNSWTERDQNMRARFGKWVDHKMNINWTRSKVHVAYIKYFYNNNKVLN